MVKATRCIAALFKGIHRRLARKQARGFEKAMPLEASAAKRGCVKRSELLQGLRRISGGFRIAFAQASVFYPQMQRGALFRQRNKAPLFAAFSMRTRLLRRYA
ncbi:MAG: hypothetical protein HP049_02530 [Clostridiales bacterium]|nr:hypothetical protein [Clostridiales bacterium]